PTQISTMISAADIGTPGAATVTVSSPGGTSSPSTFLITPIVPAISAIHPATAEIGANGFTLSVSGTNFLNTSVVRWNNSDRPTTFVSPNQLTATISYTDLLSTGAVPITVSNPMVTSNISTLTIGPPSIALFTETVTQRAIALNALTFTRDPFVSSSPNNFGIDNRTRVMIFSSNLQLSPGELVSSVTARGEDTEHRVYSLPVEFVSGIPGLNSLTQIVFRIPDELKTANSFWVSVCYGSSASNKALVMLKPGN